jgi:holliday junction DNA helicase RuvA
VGPKVALGVLSGLSVNELAHAISLQDTARLTRVPGIGKKTAERLLLELKGKLGLSEVAHGIKAKGEASTNNDVLHALLALGYNEKEAVAAMRGLEPGASVSDGIRLALKSLAK